ncbi:MAG TPA: enoyl-CoA hydratase [Rhodospirillaceae bacterium]|nr:enoyl-CoA hydratase [Rhodospirillaceae bacterium]HAA91628.1 enoyl-CoA hydratase [Rhodospirillaceae bacterium]HAT35802.1 enoyl-CoA hydratase [Rhodospirillaceae bacterium]
MANTSINKADTAPLLETFDGPVCRLTLNRPTARNALSSELIDALQCAFDRLATNRNIKVILLDGAGEGFCSGHDLKEVRALNDETAIAQLFDDCARMMQSIGTLPQPVIALVHGVATAAGCQLVASADLALATEEARFATPGVHIGLFCSTPMVPLTRTVSKKHAMEMLLTGELVSAEDAERIGLINRVVPADRLQAEGDALAAKIAEKSNYTIGLGKKTFYEQYDMPIGDAYAHCCAVMTRNMMAPDAAEGIDAFLEKRPPDWRGDIT